MKLFIAGASSQRLAVRAIIDQVKASGHIVTYDWTRAPDWDLGRDLYPSEAVAVSRLNRQGVKAADGVIWACDGDHESKGAHYEAGYAEGLGKPLVVIWCPKVPTSWIHYWDHGSSLGVASAIEAIRRKLDGTDRTPADNDVPGQILLAEVTL